MIAMNGHDALHIAVGLTFACAVGVVAALWWFGSIAEEQAVSRDYLDDYAVRLHKEDRKQAATRIQQAADQVSIDEAHALARALLNKADCAWKNAANATGATRRTDGAILRLVNGTPTPDTRDAFDRATDAQHPCIDTNGEPA